MSKFFIFLTFIFFINSYSQRNTLRGEGLGVSNVSDKSQKKVKDTTSYEKAPIDLYKIYTLQKDTTYVDTSLTIKSEYMYNLLRKDIFGLLPFANEGHTYNSLDFALSSKNAMPSFGFKAKHFNYLEATDIKYYNVPTPLTDLYFKTVMEQGQALDAFLTVNTKPNLNFSIAYRGLRSLGKYVNNLTSSGNFRFTSSYYTIDKRYFLNAHFTGQDISNQENGGIVNLQEFETSEDPFNERERIKVYFTDATSLLKGNRFFVDHSFKLNKENPNSLVFTHQFNQEYKFFEFTQPTVNERFGDTYTNKISNKTRYNHLYNKFGVAYKTKSYGDLEFFIDDNNYNYYYNSVVYDINGNITVPNSVSDRINMIGGNYTYLINKINVRLHTSQSITDQSISNIEASANYKLNDDYNFQFKYQKLNSLPNLNFTLYQSGYIDYNWFNNFKNEKLNQFEFSAQTKLLNVSATYKVLNDYLFFDNQTNNITELTVKPIQYDKTINYLSVKANKEIKFWKLALDNTILYQSVEQSDDIVNVPQIVTRNTLYFTDYVFKKAMLLQTGVTFQYFSKYYANDYNPLIGEFYVQNETKIGGFPMFDFFINARVRQARIFLKAEHFNSAWTGYDFYSAPNYPYRDFIVRFGLVWNFFR
ncbi:putative beta-barrel porin [Flavobacterium aquaticum]|uniref:Putative beta-barrel porin n=1 Tax=Flavobacterium aquaticum TaxID=1236486 RepID=A0A327YGW6_9FLAO|nr:putative porin [Flavobacterium aquaticum]RAK20133.1 putative beta-barrel porin [Flavobacterium aquaticum]